MLTEDYCNFEIAKLLKKKGFYEATIGYYYTISEIPEKIKFSDTPISIYDSDGLIGCIQAPTIQMAMKWLREVHHIFIRVIQSHIEYCACEIYYNRGSYYEFRESFNSYEEAAEAAIKYCLENLI